MPTLNFKKEFASAVEAGTKLQTIRRETDLKIRDTVVLKYDCRKMGMKFTKCECLKLGEGIVESVHPILIKSRGSASAKIVKVNGVRFGPRGLYWLAEDDGFKSIGRFLDFFEDQYGLPFKGVLIKWRLK